MAHLVFEYPFWSFLSIESNFKLWTSYTVLACCMMLHACFSFKQTEGGYWQSLLVKRHWEMKTRLAGFCTTLVRRWARPGWIRMEQGSQCRSVLCLQQPTTCLRDCSIVTKKEHKTRPKASSGSVLAGNHGVLKQSWKIKEPTTSTPRSTYPFVSLCHLDTVACSVSCLGNGPLYEPGPTQRGSLFGWDMSDWCSGDFMLISVDSSKIWIDRRDQCD